MIETGQLKHKPWHNIIPYIVLATVFLIITVVIGTKIPVDTSSSIFNELKQSLDSVVSVSPLILLILVFLNNAIKALFVIIFGVFLGVPSILFIAFNGLIIGMVITAFKAPANYGLIAAALAPHGVIEIPALILATALGMSIGIESLRFFIRQPSMTRIQLRFCLKIYWQWILPGLLVAALIEIFITPLVVSAVSGQPMIVP